MSTLTQLQRRVTVMNSSVTIFFTEEVLSNAVIFALSV